MTETSTTSATARAVSPLAFFDALAEAGVLKGPTWGPWRSFLASLFGSPLSRSEARVYRQCTGRKRLPKTAFSEGWLICGRRSGKSFALALVAVFLACFRAHAANLMAGERATVMVIATDRAQARTIFRFCHRLLTGIAPLKALLRRVTQSALELSTGVVIEIHTASFRRTRGYAICACLCDELAFWPTSEESAEPDREVLDAVRAGMAQFEKPLLLCASSPYAKRGELWNAYQRHFGKDDRNVLVWKAPTRVMNPSVPQRVIDEAFERDAAWARGEYLAEFRDDVQQFVPYEVAAGCMGEHRELLPAAGLKYFAACDPSGGSSDSFTLALAHGEGEGRIVIDAVREARPPFSPESVVDEFAALLKSYRITCVSGDRYAGLWPREQFEKRKITYLVADKSKSDAYRDLLPLLNSKRIVLPKSDRLLGQLVGLERRTARGGRDSIDHAPNGHDDIANACALAAGLVAYARKAIPASMESWSDIYGANRQRAEGAARKQAEANVAAGSRPCEIDFSQLERERTRNLVSGVTQSIGTITRIW